MAMTAFHERFRDVASRETRAVIVSAGTPIPADEYDFVEFFCADKRCDCRRVSLQVVGQLSGPKIWATINYGWETEQFYRKLAGEGWSRPILDPFNPQSAYSAFFLKVFEDMIRDKAYVDRLKRHYKMFGSFQPVAR
ncbi:hypothetical protein [Paraburkholderia sp. RL17-373-BIF-A]|uniref:hypothetical protein n=1 Tax=Paraburkholderia sp. RL17-373-BIF-A TaxID=3031629 RepID=UPI0038BD99D0